MVATFLVSVAALIIAVLGCAWLKPAESGEGNYDTADEDSGNRTILRQER